MGSRRHAALPAILDVGKATLPLRNNVWDDTAMTIPADAAAPACSVLTGERVTLSHRNDEATASAEGLFATFPAALLISDEA